MKCSWALSNKYLVRVKIKINFKKSNIDKGAYIKIDLHIKKLKYLCKFFALGNLKQHTGCIKKNATSEFPKKHFAILKHKIF